MKTLADEIFDLLKPGDRLSIGDMTGNLAADRASVRKAMDTLRDARRADIVRIPGAGRELFLVPYRAFGDGFLNVCANCGKSFQRRPKTKAMNCSKSCAQRWVWKNPEVHARRCEALQIAHNTPSALQRTARTNAARWAREGEREKLVDANKKRWADPTQRAAISRGIRAVQQKPEQRALYSDIRKKYWDDPEKRKKMVAGIRRSKSTPEARAKFSRLLSERWKDPAMREKYTRANAVRNSPEMRAVNSARMKAFWANPENAAAAREKALLARAEKFKAKHAPERLALMIAMLAEHRTLGDVAVAMGECYGFVQEWAAAEGLKSSPRKSAEVRQRISESNRRTKAIRREQCGASA